MPDVTRRRLLTAGLGLTLASTAGLAIACDPTDPSNAAPHPPEPAPAPRPAPDLDLLDGLVAAKTELIASYDRSVTVHPDLADPLAEFISRHQAHVSVLTQLQRDAADGPLPTSLPEPEPIGTQSPTPVSPDPEDPDPEDPDPEDPAEDPDPEDPDPEDPAEDPDSRDPDGEDPDERDQESDDSGVPDSPDDAVAALVDVEEAAVEATLSAVEAAHSPDLARLAASIAACERTHALLLPTIDLE